MEGNESHSKEVHDPFYSDNKPWSPPKISYPTWDDVVRFYVSRSQSKHAVLSDVIQELALFVHDIWEKGDGCPMSITAVKKQFSTKVLPEYRRYRDGDGRKSRKHKRKTPIVVGEPTRRSSRIQSPTPTSHDSSPDSELVKDNEGLRNLPEASQSKNDPTPRVTRGSSSSKGSSKNRVDWLEDHGKKLFDIFSKYRLRKMLKDRKKGISAGAFDRDFYLDQKDPDKRKYVIQIHRVTKEYYEEHRKLELKKARQYSRELSAQVVGYRMEVDQEEGSSDGEEIGVDEVSDVEEEDEDYSPVDFQFRSSAMVLRSKKENHTKTVLENKATQTECLTFSEVKDNMPHLSTRQHSNSPLIHSNYLQSGALMMAMNSMSSRQAIMAQYIQDTEVYKQKRLLPLSMQKKYQKDLNLLKKIRGRQASANEIVQEEEQGVVVDEMDENEEDDIALLETTTERPIEEENDKGHQEDDQHQETENLLQEKVGKVKREQKTNIQDVLPEPKSLRRAHHQISCFLEGRIGEEMVNSGKTFLMPDGTSRQKLGRIGASLVSVEGKMRALKTQWMGNEKRENWADMIIYQLQRLSIASSKDIPDIYKSIISIVSDACKVNKGLGAMISSKLGLTWIPGQLYCCIHTVLGFQTGIKDVWMRYQSSIGHKKMYPSVTGFEMEMEDQCLVKQVLEGFLRLTADRWQARSWNKYEEYNKFCQIAQIINKAIELHGNRFGDLERCSAIGVYSLPTWISFVEQHPNIRNQLAIFLRDTAHLADICRVLWLGSALVGIHVTFPYLYMLLDLEVDHWKLLEVLPKLYRQLVEYPHSLAQLEAPGVPALAFAWQNPLDKNTSPYGLEVSQGLQNALKMCDQRLLDRYLRDLCKMLAIILKRQRGNAYGFGDDPDSDEHVLKQMSADDLSKAPTHTKQIENLYGTEDMLLTRFGVQSFCKSQDDLIIKYSADLLDKSHSWHTKKVREKVKELDKSQKEFTQAQRDLLDAGVTPVEAIQMTTMNKVQRVVEQCRKSHNGPVSTVEELNEVLSKLTDEKLRRKAIVYEIRYRKFTVLNIKDSNPLFLQKNLSLEKLESNLRLLIQKCGLTLASEVTIDDLERVVMSSDSESCIDEISPGDSDEERSESDDEESCGNEQERPGIGPLIWPPALGDHVTVNFDSGFKIGEVLIVKGKKVKITFMHPRSIEKSKPRQFWVWGYTHERWINKEFILPIHPVLEFEVAHSTSNLLIFRLENLEMIEAFTIDSD